MSRPVSAPQATEQHDIDCGASSEPPLDQGDDDSLILWFLGLSIPERLSVAQDFADSIARLKHGLRA